MVYRYLASGRIFDLVFSAGSQNFLASGPQWTEAFQRWYFAAKYRNERFFDFATLMEKPSRIDER